MASEYEEHLAAVAAKGMAVMCFRNTPIEDFHDRTPPVSHTGDFSDVVVIDADGQRIPWPEVSHISQNEMRDLMRKVVNRLYTCQLYAGDPDFFGILSWAVAEARPWDEPELDEGMLKSLESRRKRELEKEKEE